jgi:predicted secreted protein
MAKQVTCITKKEHHNPHERIVGIGGAGWWRGEDDAIRDVERDSESYYASVGGKSVWVIVATHNGRKYLKTQTDGYAPNNLLSLPDCPK